MAKLQSVYAGAGEDTKALPVRDLGPAIKFYQTVLGFSVVSQDATTAVVRRDDVQLGLVPKLDHEPGKAGSVGFAVDDLEAMHAELEASGGKPGQFGVDEWGGKKHRTFF